MGDVRAIDDWPQIRIKIETHGRLSVRNVGRFLQSVNTAARSVPATRATAPRVELVSIASGSIEIVIAALALGVSATSLAFQIKEFFKSNTGAVRVSRDLIVSDNATSISISGGTNVFLIGHQDIGDLEDVLNETALSASGARRPSPPQVITGPQIGTLRHFAGSWWVELDRRPGMTIRLLDQRPIRESLQRDRKYRLIGEAHIASEGEESQFILRSAAKI